MQNIITVIFKNESEGFQAITELRNAPVTAETAILQMALVKKGETGLVLCDKYDGGATGSSGMVLGGLMGGLMGILGGPLGVLLMGTSGAVAGSMVDTGGAVLGAAMIETVAGKLLEGEIGLIILADEGDEADLDQKLSKFQVEILRYLAIDIAMEVDEAVKVQTELDRQARMQLRRSMAEEYKEHFMDLREEREAELEASFEEFKKNYQF